MNTGTDSAKETKAELVASMSQRILLFECIEILKEAYLAQNIQRQKENDSIQ